MSDMKFFFEYGMEPETFELISSAARALVDNGDPEKAFQVFFDQIANQCRRNDVSGYEFITGMQSYAQELIESPRNPEEFKDFFGYDECDEDSL